MLSSNIENPFCKYNVFPKDMIEASHQGKITTIFILCNTQFLRNIN